MRNLLFIISITILSFATVSCSTVKEVKGPDGSKHMLITCSDTEDCYEDAAKACGKYKIVNTSNQIGNGNSQTKMLVKCKKKKK